jgi:ribosomal-protein-alanine N-acetyltransferase
MITVPLHVVPYARRHRRAVLNLVNDGRCRLHVHLDWQTLEDWIDGPNVPMYLGWHEQTLIGILAAAPPQADTSWLRLIAIDDDADADAVLRDLWLLLRIHLRAASVREVGALLLQPWLRPHLEGIGFAQREHIVTLERAGLEAPPPLRRDVHIRHTDVRDVPLAIQVDHAAFAPMWQMSPASIRQAAREAASFTIAELGGAVVGYQISTLHRHTGHLARLAVVPGVQGSGVGGALISELVASFSWRGVTTISVNTQESNVRSRSLYTRYGFVPTGRDIAYWSALILP